MKNHWQQWQGETAVIMASGCSMTEEDAIYCRNKARVITVNNTYLLAPWADAHYSSDYEWWDKHYTTIVHTCTGQMWTGEKRLRLPELNVCPFDMNGRGLNRNHSRINWGGNSGYCAIGLAYQFGIKKVVLIGYDMKDTHKRGHWHGQHEKEIRRGFNFKMWIKRLEEMAKDTQRGDFEIVNATRDTALTCFPLVKLRDVI